MYFYVFLCIFMHFYVFLCIFMYFYVFLCIFMYFMYFYVFLSGYVLIIEGGIGEGEKSFTFLDLRFCKLTKS